MICMISKFALMVDASKNRELCRSKAKCDVRLGWLRWPGRSMVVVHSNRGPCVLEGWGEKSKQRWWPDGWSCTGHSFVAT